MAALRGKILEECIKEKGYSIAAAAKRMKISRRTFYNYFEDPDLSWQKLIEIDKTLTLNLSDKFTELSKYPSASGDQVSSMSEKEASYWRAKYIEILEKYTRFLETK